MQRRILLFILLGFDGQIMAQQSLSVTTNTITSLNTSTGKYYYANRNEPPRAIEFKERTITTAYFIASINDYFKIPADFTFIEVESNSDNIGMRHHLMQQYYEGIPLEGMYYRVHEKDGFITSANGKAVRNIKTDTQVILSEVQAFYLAVKYVNTKDTVFRHGKKLIVSKGLTFTPQSFSVAFQFDIDVSLIERWRISIDAQNGQVINKVSLVNSCFKKERPIPFLPYTTGTGLTNYYGIKTIKIEDMAYGSRLTGKTEHGGSIGTYDFKNGSMLFYTLGIPYAVADIQSNDNTFNNSNQKSAVSVQWAAEQAYEYYFKKHNRNSFDNNGSAITCYIHVDQNLDNAYWSRNKLLFGDGSNNNPLVELDVVSHELTHGVTQYEAQLDYTYEPGALNESFSDILGKAVDFYTFGSSAKWQMASHYQSGGLRDFSNPNLKNQADTYAGDLWYTGDDDNGGVHYNSGVQNFWFYLLCQGGTGVNDHQLSYSIKSIGMDSAVNITYRNLTEYLSYYSDYLDSRIGSLLATADLYGKNSTAYQEVDKAWDAVGVIDEPIITSLEPYDITATTVKIKGSLLPRGDTVFYHFEYGTTLALGSISPTYKYIDKVEGVLTALQSETKYYLKLVATSDNGSTSYTAEFKTISLAPLVRIKQTVDVTETTATLHGAVNPNSLPTSFYFEYGLTPSFGLVTPSCPMPDTTEFLNVSAPIINLEPRQTYYYRLVATNDFASSVTGSVSFFTAAKPIINSFLPISATTGTEVTIIGENFNPSPEKNVISFGATNTQVLSFSSNEIKVKVPRGASLGTIAVLDIESGLYAESVKEFVPTFEGEFKKNCLQLRAAITEPYVWKSLVQDMDGDSRPDIVSIHYEGFSVFQNVNQGGDITAESFVRSTTNVPDFHNSDDFQVIDFDGNGLKDIVGRSSNGLLIYPNFSVPGYIFFGTPVILNFSNYLDNIVYGDFDMDGRIDIAYTTSIAYEVNMLTIFRNQNPKGSISANNFEQQYTKVLPYYIEYLTTADLNNDGTSDLLIGANYKNFLSILKNNSQPGAFDFEESFVYDSTRGDRYVRYFSQDLNMDGWKDIIAHSPKLIENMAIMENKGTSPDITMEFPNVVMRDTVLSALHTADMDGDGKVDMLASLSNRQFVFLKNKVEAGKHLTDSSFEIFETYGTPIESSGNSGITQTKMIINDLNGDGRPEVINSYYYNFGPHDGYQMEIWQNAPNDCIDPSLIRINASSYSATILLPPNTTLDLFEIEYSISDYSNWNRVTSTTLSNLWRGTSYKLRARAKCYLGFTDYSYLSFITDCVDTNDFSVSNIKTNSVTLSFYYINSLEVQYSPSGKDQWEILPKNTNQISNLLPGTTYDVRFRGQCSTPAQFNYKQFTTLCPALTALNITDLYYNRATVSWISDYMGKAILEYSVDNLNWNLIDESQTLFSLIPSKKYFVRGRLACTDINSNFIYTSFTTPCPKVSMLTTDTITPFSAKVNWIDGSETGSYVLTYSMTNGGEVTTIETSLTSITLDDLSPGTQYEVAVAPQCIATKDFTSTMFTTVCYAPFNFTVDAITYNSAELSWIDNFSGLAYTIDYSISGSDLWKTSETDLTKFSLGDLRPGTDYEARVHITCISETAPYASLHFETTLYEKTTFAPNPTDNEITIYPSKNLIGNHFNIYDNAGRSEVSGELVGYTIDLSGFSSGLYILKIEGERPMKIIKR